MTKTVSGQKLVVRSSPRSGFFYDICYLNHVKSSNKLGHQIACTYMYSTSERNKIQVRAEIICTARYLTWKIAIFIFVCFFFFLFVSDVIIWIFKFGVRISRSEINSSFKAWQELLLTVKNAIRFEHCLHRTFHGET
jgi:hypothetical protein